MAPGTPISGLLAVTGRIAESSQKNNKVSSILFGDTMVPKIEQDCILLLGYSMLYKNIILLGSYTKKHYSGEVRSLGVRNAVS